MKTVALRVRDDGSIWVESECRDCGQVLDCRAPQAILAPVVCAKCQRAMGIRGAIVAAAERTPPSESPDDEKVAGLHIRDANQT